MKKKFLNISKFILHRLFFFFIFFFMLGMMTVSVWAFLPTITILDKADIVQLSDDKLIDAYIDMLVELQASKAFHTTSGFTPKEYESYKNLLRYRILLLQEIDKRKLQVPRAEDIEK